MNRILHSENLTALRTLPSASVELIYIDPPFNTGTTQTRPRLKTIRDDAGDRTGFGGNRNNLASPGSCRSSVCKTTYANKPRPIARRGGRCGG